MFKQLTFKSILIFIFLLSISCSLVNASDIKKELRMKRQIFDAILDGEPTMLNAGSHQFLSIDMLAETTEVKGAIIIIHGRGLHPDWPGVTHELRSKLPQYGWRTLSIQMPILDNDASFYDYLKIIPESYPRLNAAILYLRQQDIKNIVLLAHSCGVHAAVSWLDKNKSKDISAFIGIGMGTTDQGQPMLKPFPLENIDIPILDIRGEYEYPSVFKNAPRRLEHIKQAGNKKSLQLVVKNANHYFTDHENTLLNKIVSWLDGL